MKLISKWKPVDDLQSMPLRFGRQQHQMPLTVTMVGSACTPEHQYLIFVVVMLFQLEIIWSMAHHNDGGVHSYGPVPFLLTGYHFSVVQKLCWSDDTTSITTFICLMSWAWQLLVFNCPFSVHHGLVDVEFMELFLTVGWWREGHF